MNKLQRLSPLVLVFALPCQAEPSWYLGANLSQTKQEVSFFSNSETSTNRSLSALATGLQVGLSQDNYSVTLSFNHASDDNQWLNGNSEEAANFKQQNWELSYSHYFDNWSVSASYGQSDYEFDTRQTFIGSTRGINFAEANIGTGFDNDDTFFELAASRWFNLSKLNSNLAASIEIAATVYQSTGLQLLSSELIQTVESEQATLFLQRFAQRTGLQLGVENVETFDLDGKQTLVSLSGSLDYAGQIGELDAYYSLWGSYEISDGELTLTRAGRGRAPIPRPFLFGNDNTPETEDQLLTLGADASVNISKATSLTLSVYDTDAFDTQYQLSVFHNF